MWFLVWASTLWAWSLKGESEALPSELDTKEWLVLSDTKWAQSAITIDPLRVAAAAAHTLEYMHQNPDDSRGVHAGMLEELNVDLEDVKATLAIIAFVGLNYPSLLQDPNWWANGFDHYAWRGDTIPRTPHREHQIRLTRYVIYAVEGSKKKTAQFPHALWQVPLDELELDEAKAHQHCPQNLRCQLTRQDILAGALEQEHAGKANPLIWVSEYHFHEAQLQGTMVVRDETQTAHWFNVHRSNHHPYIKGLPPAEQARYWFFQRTDGAYGWGTGTKKIALHPGVSMAGDVDNLGLGKVFWIQSSDLTTIGILSDTGGAFQGNLQQLDWFMGVYPDRQSLDQNTKNLPRYANIGILIRKRDAFQDGL